MAQVFMNSFGSMENPLEVIQIQIYPIRWATDVIIYISLYVVVNAQSNSSKTSGPAKQHANPLRAPDDWRPMESTSI